MLSPFFCGSFHQEEDDEPWSHPSTPRKSKKSSLSRSKNPYSTRGLDKFSELLSDLEEKRQKIYSQMGSQDISFVRFAYSNSNDCTPIVVKLRDKKQDKTKLRDTKDNPITHNSEALLDDSAAAKDVEKPRLEAEQKTKKKSFSWNFMKLDRLRRPSYYFPAVIILILLFLAVFGRSVAILCTTLGWYFVPTIKAKSTNSKRQMHKKKEYTRRMSENKLVSDGLSSQKKVYQRKFSENKMVTSDGLSSPKTNNNNAGAAKDRSSSLSPERGHRKSW